MLADWIGIRRARHSGVQSHVIGGNPAVIAAISGNDDLAFGEHGRGGYLSGKYRDRSAGEFTVKRDDGWPTLPSDVRHEINLRITSRRATLDRLSQQLGHM